MTWYVHEGKLGDCLNHLTSRNHLALRGSGQIFNGKYLIPQPNTRIVIKRKPHLRKGTGIFVLEYCRTTSEFAGSNSMLSITS